MNNFINFSRKMQRARLERTVMAQSKELIPNVEQYLASHRFPTMPKIVVYSASSHSDSFLNKYFLPTQDIPFLPGDFSFNDRRN